MKVPLSVYLKVLSLLKGGFSNKGTDKAKDNMPMDRKHFFTLFFIRILFFRPRLNIILILSYIQISYIPGG